jgi:hypothetical protein
MGANELHSCACYALLCPVRLVQNAESADTEQQQYLVKEACHGSSFPRLLGCIAGTM